MSRVQKARPRDTGPTQGQKRLVVARADGRCELCPAALWTKDLGWIAPHSFHHRQPRGMGGSQLEDNNPARLLLLCGTGVTGCHGMVESQRVMAYANGWLVKRPTDPAVVPAVVRAGRRLLTTDGRYEEPAA